ncbi:MAG TPA: methyltransferase [Gaiellaceae bacterium]|nr:methyltransferase [Gaiellaceae bacterium]
MTWPIADRDAAGSLGRALRELSYDEDSVDALLDDEVRGAAPRDVPVYERRLDASPLATAVRLFLLELPVTRGALEEAVGGNGAAAVLRIGLAQEQDGLLVPRSRLLPVEGLLLAFDHFSRGDDDPEGYVAAYSPTASWLAALTPRRRVQRALDVGTGNGIHALLASRHAARVVATDVNDRALAYTELNAALNGIANVEPRKGSLFEPVAGETFDLITCNAPYVVSPERRWQYRDAGLPADEVSQRVVEGCASALAAGGFASMLVSWVAESRDDPDVRLDEWLDGTGCDAWVLGLSGADPLDHAAGWNEHLAEDRQAFAAALDEWVEYFERLGVEWISEGAVLLHKRAARQQTIRADDVDEDELEYAGDQIERAFAARALLDRLPDRKAVLETRFTLADAVEIEHRRGDGTDEARLVLDEGTHAEVVVDLDAADVLAALDGRLTLGDAVDRIAKRLELSRSGTTQLRRDVVAATVELFELGMAELVDA